MTSFLDAYPNTVKLQISGRQLSVRLRLVFTHYLIWEQIFNLLFCLNSHPDKGSSFFTKKKNLYYVIYKLCFI